MRPQVGEGGGEETLHAIGRQRVAAARRLAGSHQVVAHCISSKNLGGWLRESLSLNHGLNESLNHRTIPRGSVKRARNGAKALGWWCGGRGPVIAVPNDAASFFVSVSSFFVCASSLTVELEGIVLVQRHVQISVDDVRGHGVEGVLQQEAVHFEEEEVRLLPRQSDGQSVLGLVHAILRRNKGAAVLARSDVVRSFVRAFVRSFVVAGIS